MESSRLLVISSDGHATARMEEYLEYLDPAYRDEFEDFCVEYRAHGAHNWEAASLSVRTDPDVVDAWVRDVIEPGRVEGLWDPQRRLAELGAEGVVGEVLIPDFGRPFELYPPALAARKGYTRDQENVDVSNRAYNRWLVDFVSSAPDRFAGMAALSFSDVGETVRELRWAKEAGLRGVMLPKFEESRPLFSSEFDPVWATMSELGLVANSHTGITATTTTNAALVDVPHPACIGPLQRGSQWFYTHQVLDHLIWGGVLERHPSLVVVFTEQGSGWVAGTLTAMDHTYEGSFMRRDIREVIKTKPSEYFARQCYIGSSLLSRAEVENRRFIGVDKMMFGVDYPHHEGAWNGGTVNYLRATFGAAGVPLDEAERMLGTTAASVYGFDVDRLRPIADEVGPTPEEILSPPTEDRFPRGDVHKPLAGALI
jgi:predicted TIM-barrel fold metal-dependent hydrolase